MVWAKSVSDSAEMYSRKDEVTSSHVRPLYSSPSAPIGALAMSAATEAISLRANIAHILNTPNVVGGIGAFNDAEIASPSTSRVCTGSMMPSSHSRAVA